MNPQEIAPSIRTQDIAPTMSTRKIAPSMMCVDMLHIADTLDLFEDKRIEYLHVDVMDGHYVPNFTIGIDFCRALRSYSSIPLDIHLMIENVDTYIPTFAELENVSITFHPEVCYHPLRTIQLIRSLGARAGIGIDPSISLEQVKSLIPSVDMICIMTVNPGYAGQALVPQGMKLLREASTFCKDTGAECEIEVDGNVSWENIPKMLDAGADVFVAGTSSLFTKGTHLPENIDRMRLLFGQP